MIEVRLAALEERREDLLEVGPDLLEGLAEELACRPVDLLDGLQQVLARLQQIVPLLLEELQPRLLFVVLVECDEVHRPDLLELLLPFGE